MKESEVSEEHREALGREPWAQESAALKPAKGFIYEARAGGRVVLERPEPDDRRYGENAWHHGGAVSSVPNSVSTSGWRLVGVQTPNGPVTVGECRAYDGKPNADHGLGQVENVVAQNGVAVRRLDGVLTVWEADVVATWPFLQEGERAAPKSHREKTAEAYAAASVNEARLKERARRGLDKEVRRREPPERSTPLAQDRPPSGTAPVSVDHAYKLCGVPAPARLSKPLPTVTGPDAWVKPDAWARRHAAILDLLREDRSVHPAFARAREVAVATACESRINTVDEVRDLLLVLHRYEERRGGMRTPKTDALPCAVTLLGGDARRPWGRPAILAYERARA
jgi:hypothetical protein